MDKSNQVLLEESIRGDIAQMYAESHTFNGLMKPELIECSYEEKSITAAFPVMEWQKNRAGYMHGGLIASAFDITMGLLSRGLDTVFIRQIPVGDTFIVKAKANHDGKTLTHLYGEGFIKSTGKIAATAKCSYYFERKQR
jgi:acyl-coenzyme A thioesterase PaaI-like protein